MTSSLKCVNAAKFHLCAKGLRGAYLCSMTTFLGVWHQSLGVTSKWLRGRRCVRGGDSRLHCTVLPAVPLAGGRGTGYVASTPPKRRKKRQKRRTAPMCSVVSPCTGRNCAALRRSSVPLHASQARATLRRPAAPADQSRRPRRARLLPQERPHAEKAEVDVNTTSLSAEMVRGIIIASRGGSLPPPRTLSPGRCGLHLLSAAPSTSYTPRRQGALHTALDTRHACTVASHDHSHAPRRPSPPLSPRFSALCLRWLS